MHINMKTRHALMQNENDYSNKAIHKNTKLHALNRLKDVSTCLMHTASKQTTVPLYDTLQIRQWQSLLLIILLCTHLAKKYCPNILCGSVVTFENIKMPSKLTDNSML